MKFDFMTKKNLRSFALVLILAFCFAALTATAVFALDNNASSEASATSGEIDVSAYGEAVKTWSLSSTTTGSTVKANLYNDPDNEGFYILVIDGNGGMVTSWSSASKVSWYSYRANIKKVLISDTVTSLARFSFYNFTKLESITLPSGITSIPDKTFYGCSSLESIKIPSGVTTIGEQAFYQCTNLKSINLPEGLKTINSKAFLSCAIRSVTLPSTLTSIGTSAFQGCEKLYKVVNNSNFSITLHDTSNGYVGYYAYAVIDADGNKTCYYDSSIGNTYFEKDDFIFFNGYFDKTYRLVYYAGIDDTVTLPLDYEGNPYTIVGLDGIKNIIVPEGFTEISGFSNSTSLETVQLPSTLTTINPNAFRECRILKSINIPSSVTSIGDWAFYECTSLNNIKIENDSSLESIGEYAFSQCTNLENVSGLENSKLTTIKRYAFNLCTSLTAISLPNSIEEIKEYAFYSCEKLNIPSFTDNSSIKTIGDMAFANCYCITEIYIPKSATSIVSSSYSGCKGTKAIGASAENSKYMAIGNCLVEKDTKVLLIGCKNSVLTATADINAISAHAFEKTDIKSIIIPTTVSAIGEYAFNGCESLVSVTFADEAVIKSIGGYAFNSCTALVNITIPDTVTSLGTHVFEYCDALESVTLPSGITSIGERFFFRCYKLNNVIIPNGVTSIGNSAFYSCTALESISLPDSVTSIGDNVFYECASLQSIRLSSNLTAIPPYAFDKCYKLTSIELPSNITSIGSGAFRECTSLQSIVIPDGVTIINQGTFNQCYMLESVEMSDNITKIGPYAFQGCQSLKSFNMPKYVTDIDVNAFYGCTGLTSIELPNTLKSLGSYAFQACARLTSIKIPGSLSLISSYAFDGCNALVEIEISDGVTQIGDYAFNNCLSLKSVTIPGSVATIGIYAFNYCSSLETVVICDGVQKIYSYAFQNCNSLKSVTIPSTLSTVGGELFTNCPNIRSVYISDIKSWLNISFYGQNNSNPLYPGADLYLNNELVTELIIPDGVSTVGALSFKGCTSITRVVLPDSLTAIALGAFLNCVNLKTINIPNGVTSMGISVFENCTSLENVTLPNTITKIDSSTFKGCTSLENIIIPESVTYINNEAFYGCSSLSSISLPQSVTTIGSSAFGGCANLKLVEIKNQSIVNALTSQTSAGYIIYNAETIITDATVSTSGYVWRNFSCRGSVSYTNVDGETVSFTLYSKHYHNDTSAIWTDISRAPTYTSIGFNGYKCSSCGIVKGEELAALKAYITGSNLTIGSDLTINVYALVDDGFESLAIRFTMNGKSHLITPKKSSGQYKFAFEGVSPQHMNDTVTAELIVNGEVVSTLSNCGVREYCDQLLTYSAEELGYTEEQFASLLILMKDMLAYGAEAQIFTNYNTDSLANEGIEGGSVFEEFECNDKSIIYHNTVDGVGFTAYNLRFDNVNYLYFKFKAPDVSLASVKITVGTKTVTLTADDFERSGDAYIALTDDILATGFGKVYTATLIYDGVEIQSLTYSVNAYAYGKQNQTTEGGELTSMARLARATYLYGKSARAYYDLMKKGQ